MDELRVIRPHQRDAGTAQTAGARSLWMGAVRMEPGVRSGAHHHGDAESGIYVISGRARFRFGPRLEHTVDAGPGDFVFVPPHAVHQEINLSQTEPVEMIVGRDRQENLVVNVNIPEAASG